MSELNHDQPEELETDLEVAAEFEEITSEEVDRVVESLDQIIESVSSENIKHQLEQAAAAIYYLVYEDDLSEDDSVDQAA